MISCHDLVLKPDERMYLLSFQISADVQFFITDKIKSLCKRFFTSMYRCVAISPHCERGGGEPSVFFRGNWKAPTLPGVGHCPAPCSTTTRWGSAPTPPDWCPPGSPWSPRHRGNRRWRGTTPAAGCCG